MEEKQLDSVLVPLGLAIFLGYHLWLLFTIIRNPTRTVIGINSQTRHKWVFCLMAVSFLPLPFYFLISIFDEYKNKKLEG